MSKCRKGFTSVSSAVKVLILIQHLASVVTMLAEWKGLKLPSFHPPSVLLSPVLCSCDLTCRPTEREREREF